MFSIIVAVLFVIKIYSNSVHSLPKFLGYLLFNLSLTTKSSQQHKTARHCRTPMKSNNVTVGFYLWLLQTRLPANRDC